MSRPCSVLLLLLGLTSPAAAQTASPTAWTLASGDFTIYGHTDYTPTSTLRPRIVYDTVRGLDSARIVDSVRLASTSLPGLAAGLSAWPAGFYCDGPASATVQRP